MTIDKEKLKSLAEAAGRDEWYSAGDLRYCDDKTGAVHGLHHDDSRFIADVSPATIQALLAEIERLERKNANQSESIREYQDLTMGGDVSLGLMKADLRVTAGERDELKAEREVLRKDAERYRWLREPWQDQRRVRAWTSLEVMDENIDEAMAKEAK